eukprot:g3776.t1
MASLASKAIDYDKAILEAVNAQDDGTLSSLKLASTLSCPHQEIIAKLQSLTSDEYILTKAIKRKQYVLTDEALSVLQNGSPEFNLLNEIRRVGLGQPVSMKELPKALTKVGLGKAKQNKWISMNKGQLELTCDDSVKDILQEQLKTVQEKGGDENALSSKDYKNLEKRKMCKAVSNTYLSITKGPKFATQRTKIAADLTADMIQNGAWKQATFRPANFQSLGRPVGGGHLHPLMK